MLAFLAIAAASTPVIHDGGAGAVHVQAVVERSGLPPDQLRAVSITEIFARPPLTLGQAVVRRCSRAPATMAEARGELVRAEAGLAAGNDIDVADHLDLAVALLGCLSEVVDPPAAARVFLLRGALAAEAGRTKDAQEELRTALSLDPTPTWPPSYPAAGSHALAQVLQEEDRVTLTTTPKATSGPWIDGAEHPLQAAKIRTGLHLAQHSARAGLTTSWLLVGGDATWALPDALPTSVLDQFTTGQADAPAKVLAGAFPDAAAVYVAHRGGLWLVQAEGANVIITELTPATPVVEEPESSGKKPKKKKKRK